MDRYHKLNMIGNGTFGSVWLVESKTSGNKYAVKELSVRTMSDTDRHLALNEVKILSKLKHKNIIRYKDAIHQGVDFYIIMEYAEGGDLYTKIKQSQGLFQQEQILDWLTQLLLALKHIHGFNILHRDLKTQNIFLTKSSVIKLGDFGIARILDSTTDHAQTTVGTPYYLSPEICQQQPYNQKSDMWALGCVMYEITALVPPFTAGCFSSLVVKILHGKYTPIPRIYGPLLQDLIDILLRANPQDRPTAKQLLHVPAMKPYVEKFAVIKRERTESVASVAYERKNPAENRKSQKAPLSKDFSTEPFHEKPAIARKQRSESVANVCKTFTENLKLNDPPNMSVSDMGRFGTKQTTQAEEDGRKVDKESVLRPVEEKEEISFNVCSSKLCVEVTVHQQPKTENTKQAKTGQSEMGAIRQGNVINVALEGSAADRIRQSILREHARQRRRSAVSSTACDGSGSNLNVNEREEKSTRKHTRIQSESSALIRHRSEKVVPNQSKHDKGLITNKNKGLVPNQSENYEGLVHYSNMDEKELVPNQRRNDKGLVPIKKIAKQLVLNQRNNAEEIASKSKNTRKELLKVNGGNSEVKNSENQRIKSVTQAAAPFKENSKPTESKTNGRPPNERDNAQNQQPDIHAKNCHKTPNIDIHRVFDALKQEQTKKNSRRSMDGGERGCRSRDRAASVPGVCQARARRQAARESLEQHMHHCRRARKTSKRTLSREHLDKENICPILKNESGQFKTVTKRKSAVQPQQRLDAMVETRESFKRCETYKVAQFRRLPLMSVPDVTEYADSNSTEANKPENKTRHKSESFLNPKLTFNKFKGIRGVQIDKARRRAKKITTNIDVDSSRSEFSIKPDQACTTQIKSSTLSYKQPKKPGVAKTSNESKENSQESADSKLKFKFRGKTLHLNATDAKSTFAHIEALRVFLEENLGTERFIEAYQYLNGSSLFTTKKDTNKDDAGLESILGRYNIDYLPLLTQLIASEANHFGTSV